MCGIVGYIGHRDAHSIIIKGLQRLEYRGYDSAGIALFDGKDINVTKTKGKVSDLQDKINSSKTFIFYNHGVWTLAKKNTFLID